MKSIRQAAWHLFYFLLVAGITLLFFPPPGFAAEDIRITADRMVSQEQENSVVFMGHVNATQGDTVIQCEEMTIFYTQEDKKKKSSSSSSRVKKLICKENVKVTNGDWLGIGKRMDYFEKDRKIILSGKAQAWQGQNMVQGETITHYLDKKSSTVEQNTGQKGGVQMLIPQSAGSR